MAGDPVSDLAVSANDETRDVPGDLPFEEDRPARYPRVGEDLLPVGIERRAVVPPDASNETTCRALIDCP